MDPTAPPRGAALVTGAGRRIGRAVALALAEAGFDLAVHYGQSREAAQEVVSRVAALGRNAVALDADLCDAAAVEALCGRAAAAIGPLSVLVNNASTFADDAFGSLTRPGWEAHLTPNLTAPVFLAQAFCAQVPSDRELGGCAIVNIIDQRVLKPTPQFFSYAVSKAALWHATRMMAQALAPAIRVNAVAPGPTLASVHQTPETFAAEVDATLLQRAPAPEEIASACLYLIDAKAVTGQMITVDAGQHLSWRTLDVVSQL